MILNKSVWCILFAYAEENEVYRGLKTIKGNTLHVLTSDGSQYGGAMVEDRPGGTGSSIIRDFMDLMC